MKVSTLLIVAGVLLILAGLLWSAGIKLGKLPGDIVVSKGNFTFYFPLTTCIILSVILTLVFIVLRSG